MKRFLTFALALLMLLSLLPSVLADSPHTHNWKEKSRVEPTCTKDGYAVYTCSCGERKTEKLPALGHEWAEKVYTGYADCEHYGVFYWVCSRCGAHSDTGNDKPLGHDWDAGTLTKAPTETEEGEITYYCKRNISHTKTEAVPALGSGEAKPELKIEWLYDKVRRSGDSSGYYEHMTEPYILELGDSSAIVYTVTNTGNIPVVVVDYAEWDNGSTDRYCFGLYTAPGDTETEIWTYGDKNGIYFDPGSETDDLLGTVTIHYYAVGELHGEEVCRTETITHTWTFRKNNPGEAGLGGSLEVRPGYESSDPAGYQLSEPVSTVLYVKNTGIAGIDSFTVTDPYDGTAFTDGPIAAGEEKSYVRADTVILQEAVEDGYIDFPAVSITWTDPYSEDERSTETQPLHLTVLSRTGLLLKKGVAFEPDNHEYFQVGEPIQWSLTVTNNSGEPIKNVTVEDNGKTVGSYAEIVPDDTKNCTVPVHIVTEYDAKVVGYVLNSATATGTDLQDAAHTWPSNVAKALTKKVVPGGDPKGDIVGLHPAVVIVKAEDPHGPLNGEYYEVDEKIDYIITVKNIGDTELKDIVVTDSLAGFAPIGTLESLMPSEKKTFTYSYTVRDGDTPFEWVYNNAVITYSFGDNVAGTPKISNTVQSKVGDNDDLLPPVIPHLDPEKIPNGEDWCSLALEALGDTEARYTLHACAPHAEAAREAEKHAQIGDFAKAAELWKTEAEKLYEALYEAADSELKCALVAERAAYYDYVDSLQALSDEAAANELRIKCALLCCALHTAPEDLASSLASKYALMTGGEEHTESTRVIGSFTGSDSAVNETYTGSAAHAQKNVIDLMDIESSDNWDKVFARGIQLWQSALDSDMSPIYNSADRETRSLIAMWRISLDSLSAAERPFLELLYEGNDIAIQETLMDLYKGAALTASTLR